MSRRAVRGRDEGASAIYDPRLDPQVAQVSCLTISICTMYTYFLVQSIHPVARVAVLIWEEGGGEQAAGQIKRVSQEWARR